MAGRSFSPTPRSRSDPTPDDSRHPMIRRAARQLAVALFLVFATLSGLRFGLFVAPDAVAQQPTVDKTVAAAERARIEVIKKVSPAVVAVCQPGGQALGSGVLIDPEGYALTNYHVTEAVGGPFMRCGLQDGILY